MKVAMAKFRFWNSRRSTTGLRLAQLPDHGSDQARRRDDRTPDDEARCEPVLPLALVEHYLDEAQADADQPQADEVDLEALLEGLADQVRRVLRPSSRSSASTECLPER